jgi:large subunit ribosomal protein L15
VKLTELKPAPGSRRTPRRVGRGSASGQGTTAGRGTKGQKSRSGGNLPVWFEGGQMPIQRRLPKRGFTNVFRRAYQVVNLKDLSRFEEGEPVNRATLFEKGLISRRNLPVKLLGDGTVNAPLQIEVDAFSRSAGEAVAAAGGTIKALRRAKKPRRGRPRPHASPGGKPVSGEGSGKKKKKKGKAGAEGETSKSSSKKGAKRSGAGPKAGTDPSKPESEAKGA